MNTGKSGKKTKKKTNMTKKSKETLTDDASLHQVTHKQSGSVTRTVNMGFSL